MNSMLVVILALATLALAEDKVADQVKTGCQLLVGKSGRDLPVGSQVCWRHPEYLTCVGGGSWVPRFCPKGQKCAESGGKATCVEDPFAGQPQNTPVEPSPSAGQPQPPAQAPPQQVAQTDNSTPHPPAATPAAAPEAGVPAAPDADVNDRRRI